MIDQRAAKTNRVKDEGTPREFNEPSDEGGTTRLTPLDADAFPINSNLEDFAALSDSTSSS